MRYALTIQTADSWNSVDTLIIEDRNDEIAKLVANEDWAGYDRLLVKMLEYNGWTMEIAVGVVEDKRYFVRNCEDIDIGIADSIVDKDGVERADYFTSQ